jgi:hypothetical protein
MADPQDIPRHLAAVAEAMATFRDQMECTGHAFVAWGHALYADAEAAYLVAHGQLPGAQTTARLRKKRQALVWRWYMAQLEGEWREQEDHTHG